jgi:hypothetical protein
VSRALAIVGSAAEPVRAPARCHRLADLAKAWGVSEALLRKEIAAGRLVCYRIGRSVLIGEQDADKYLASRRQGA